MKTWNLILFLQLAFFSIFAQAHVKWFAENTEDNIPIKPSNLNQPAFWGLLLLSVVTIAGLVYLDRKIEKLRLTLILNQYLESFTDRIVVILRVFTGASLLLTWQADAMIAPELHIPTSGVGWLEFFLALFLLTAKTTPLAGLGMIGVYFLAMFHYGFFHLLDYVIYPAIGYFLFVSSFKNQKIFNSRIPVLYIGLGFSLCWVALEKLFFPHWGLNVLAKAPELTMGLPPDFFLMSTAFVELSLGYLLIIGILQRPLALTITLVFFTTTAFFGKTEVIGHTLIHGALLVFVVVGAGGYYPPPIEWQQRLSLRALFAAVNFVVLGSVLGCAYWQMSS